MEKRKFGALAVMTFSVALITSAILGGSTQCAELGLLQNAMRGLRRTDNLEFFYETTIVDQGGKKSEKILVWADQLSGSWVSEQYTTDENETRLTLKRFCDGQRVYHYIEWNGEWELQEAESIDVPYLDKIIDLPYDSEDITNIKLEKTMDMQELSYQFTSSYIEKQNQKYHQMLEEYYEDYQKRQTSDEGAEKVELAVEQYRKTREKNRMFTYQIDAAGVMRGLYCTIVLVSPQIIYNSEGQQVLGEEQEISYVITVGVNRYNQDGILNKIEQCRNEMLHYE